MNRTNPFDDIEQLFGRSPFGGDRAWSRDDRTADVDVAEYDDELLVMADLPGYDRETIDVRVTDGRLTIRAERDSSHGNATRDDETRELTDHHEGSHDDANRRYLRRERRHESITRSIEIPIPVREDEASATFRNGVLTVTLPKPTDHRTDDGHRIDIE